MNRQLIELLERPDEREFRALCTLPIPRRTEMEVGADSDIERRDLEQTLITAPKEGTHYFNTNGKNRPSGIRAKYHTPGNLVIYARR